MRTQVLALVLLMPTLAPAVVWRHDADPKAALALGASIPAVGRVLPDGSATLIAPTWAITAAHVAQRVDMGSQVEFGGVSYPVARVFVHPQGHADPARPRQPPEVDLALLELARPVAGITPLPIYRGRGELGTTMTIVGCGDFGAAGAARTRQDGRCRAVTNVVADAGPHRLFFSFDAPPAGTRLEGIGVAGDSGGAALIAVNGTLQIAGVSSGGDGPPGAYGSTDIYTRVSSYLDWIEATHTAGR